MALSGCTTAPVPAASPGGPVPVATPPPQVRSPVTGAPGQVAVVAAGSVVRGEGLPGGAVAVARLRGPVLDAQGLGVRDRSRGTLTVQVDGVEGATTVGPAELLSRDDSGDLVPLDLTPSAVTVGPGQSATLTLTGTWEAGRAYLAWLTPTGPVATWTFDVELD